MKNIEGPELTPPDKTTTKIIIIVVWGIIGWVIAGGFLMFYFTKP
jgi:hypothetical protein